MFVRIGWKSLPGTNTLACYENYEQKSFITLASDVKVIKHFVRNLLIFIIGYNVYMNRLEKLPKDKH